MLRVSTSIKTKIMMEVFNLDLVSISPRNKNLSAVEEHRNDDIIIIWSMFVVMQINLL